jgi:hypothetical protein
MSEDKFYCIALSACALLDVGDQKGVGPTMFIGCSLVLETIVVIVKL